MELQTIRYNPEKHKKSLNLGCGKRIHPDFDNVDRVDPGKLGIILVDLFEEPWPIPTDTYDYCFSNHFFEHIPRGKVWWTVMNELFRVMKNKSVIEIRCPYPTLKTLIDCDHHRLIDVETFGPFMKKEAIGLGKTQFNGDGHLSLIFRKAWGQYHIQKYLKLTVPPYKTIQLCFSVCKEG